MFHITFHICHTVLFPLVFVLLSRAVWWQRWLSFFIHSGFISNVLYINNTFFLSVCCHFVLWVLKRAQNILSVNICIVSLLMCSIKYKKVIWYEGRLEKRCVLFWCWGTSGRLGVRKKTAMENIFNDVQLRHHFFLHQII